MTDKKHLTVREVAAELGVSPAHAHKLVTKGRILAVDVGVGGKAIWRISREDLDQYLAAGRTQTAGRFGGDAA